MDFAVEMDGIEPKAGIWFGEQRSLCIHFLQSGAGRKPATEFLPHRVLIMEQLHLRRG